MTVRTFLALALAFFALPASAACTGDQNSQMCSDEGEAHAGAWTSAESGKVARCQQAGGLATNAAVKKESNYWQPGAKCHASYNPAVSLGTYYFNPVYRWPDGQTCSGRPNEFGWMTPPNQGGVCSNGCEYILTAEMDGSKYHAPTGNLCNAAEMPPPVPDSDGDGVPDADDAFPDDPNESADADGDGIGDNADFAPDDETDGEDTPGEEDGDDEGDNTASGGGDCKSPPTCSGDGIQCNQLFQQWSMRCKGINLTGDPTICTAGYSCSGDVAQCAMIALQRKTACKDAGTGGPGGGTGDANGNGVADALEGTGGPGEGGEDVDPRRFGLGLNPSMLDTQNLFGGGSCPEPPTFEFFGATVSGGDFPHWCNAMAILRALILIFGSWTALQILTGRWA